ncbi:unnamed protein product [Hanseniaspora opuntiae]
MVAKDSIYNSTASSLSEEFVRSILEGNPNSIKSFKESLNLLATQHHSSGVFDFDLVSNQKKWWYFLQGLAVGQVTVLLIFVFFIKFFIFSDTKTPDPKRPSDSILAKLSIIKLGGKERLIDESEEAVNLKKQLSVLLEKTQYNVNTHPTESLGWFNVLVASSDPTIEIGSTSLEATIDIDWEDRLAFGVETQLSLNFPKPLSGSLPMELTISLIKFQATLTFSLTTGEEFAKAYKGVHATEEDMSGYFLMFSFSPEYTMEFKIDSLIGSTTKLENIPKISDIIQYQIKKWFVERCVNPRFQFTRLPNVWPRTKNTGETKAAENDDKQI